MQPLRIGLIGCGHIGLAVHCESLRRMADVRLAALADSDPHRRRAANARFPQAVPFDDYRKLLEQGETDGVIVCLPNALHADAATEAFDHGQHVYLEKPLGISLDEGRRVTESWRRSGRIGMIGFNYRSNPLHQEMRRLVQAGVIGELIGVRSAWTTASHAIPEWKASRRTGGGVMLDLASHHFDLIKFWLDQDIVEVNASVCSQRLEDDTATVQLRLNSGLLAECFFSMSSVEDERFEIYGSLGKLSFDRFNSWSVEVTDLQRSSIFTRYLRRLLTSFPTSRYAISKLRASGREPSFAAALARFVRAASTCKQLHPNLDDGLQSLRVVIAAEESARKGQAIRLAPPGSDFDASGPRQHELDADSTALRING
jgi:myo-inositol 2-dehydrogenase / D-chiro-inositol 1-dehydrogenase